MAPIVAEAPFLLGMFLALAAFVVLYVVIESFRSVGFTLFEVVLVLFIAPLVAGIHVPVWREGAVVFAVNLAGFAVPVFVAARAFFDGRMPRIRGALAVSAVAIVVHATSR
ncbi:MAG: hypothetical protein ACT4PT_05865, partial [Methanobacteriota archaeon]